VSVLGLRAPPALIPTGPLRSRSSVVRVPALAASASARSSGFASHSLSASILTGTAFLTSLGSLAASGAARESGVD
ncbi:MAG: hypothetical protein ACI8RZ_002708, partial [Myxococcota bacterium]